MLTVKIFKSLWKSFFGDNKNLVFIMSDTAHFYFNRMVIKQIRCHWFHTNAREIHARPRLHQPHITYSVLFDRQELLRFIFRENEQMVTVGLKRYTSQLLRFFWSQNYARINLVYFWFQQDGATTRMTNAPMTVNRNMFPGRVISRFGYMQWLEPDWPD